eukprot:g19015.t1
MLILLSSAVLLALFLTQREGCEDSAEMQEGAHDLSWPWDVMTARRSESVNMASLFVAGVLTKMVSRLAAEPLLWASAL